MLLLLPPLVLLLRLLLLVLLLRLLLLVLLPLLLLFAATAAATVAVLLLMQPLRCARKSRVCDVFHRSTGPAGARCSRVSLACHLLGLRLFCFPDSVGNWSIGCVAWLPAYLVIWLACSVAACLTDWWLFCRLILWCYGWLIVLSVVDWLTTCKFVFRPLMARAGPRPFVDLTFFFFG